MAESGMTKSSWQKDRLHGLCTRAGGVGPVPKVAAPVQTGPNCRLSGRWSSFTLAGQVGSIGFAGSPSLLKQAILKVSSLGVSELSIAFRRTVSSSDQHDVN